MMGIPKGWCAATVVVGCFLAEPAVSQDGQRPTSSHVTHAFEMADLRVYEPEDNATDDHADSLSGGAPRSFSVDELDDSAAAANADATVVRDLKRELIVNRRKGAAIAFNLDFRIDSAQLTPDGVAQLDTLADAIMVDQLAPCRFLIEGHTDATGDDAHNMQLSWARARSVREHLVRTHGVRSDRLQYVGKGESELIEFADPESAINRRIVIVNTGC